MPTPRNLLNIADFERITQLGAGAAGDVWKAELKKETQFANKGDIVALKLYNPQILTEPAQRERIAREYRTGAMLVHPNLVRIYHVDVEAPEPFLVMEYCEGENLQDWRSKNGEPDEAFLLQFSTQMLDVIDFLHSSKRFHRDVKPTNINIDHKGRVRLLDYGITRSLREPHITDSGAKFVGTYRYSAPEYIFENEYDFASDLYSFGAVLFFLLHGKEIFAGVRRTADVISAKQTHLIKFDTKLSQNGPVWAALLEVCEQLLQRESRKRPASAMACVDVLAKAVPSSIPYRVYFACSLTRMDAEQRKRSEEVQSIVRRYSEQNGFSVYLPGEHTHPLGAPDLTAPEVYWIDRERVANSDLLFVLADEPSFGVGQEAEIAANAGVPIVIFHSENVNVSRMLRGIAGRILDTVSFTDESDLEAKARQFFALNKSRFRVLRNSRDREYHLRVGNRVRDLREAEDLSVDELAERAEVNKELLASLETRPERLSNTSLINLRRIARALNVPLAELLKDQSGKDEEFEELFRASVASLRKYALRSQLPYIHYAQLKAHGRETLRHQMEATARAARGTPESLRDDDWQNFHLALIRSELEPKITDPVSKD